MKKIIACLAIVLLFFCLKNYLKQPKLSDTSGFITNRQDDQVTGSDTDLAQKIKNDEVSRRVSVQAEIKSPPIKSPPIKLENKLNSQNTPVEKTLEQLAQEKLKVPISEELKNAEQFTAWDSSGDKLFTGIYEGPVNIKGQEYHIRMNLMFDGTNDNVDLRTCVAMYSPEKTIFREEFGNGNIKLLRTKDEKYMIISVSERFYFQIFQTNSAQRRSCRTHLTVPKEKKPFVFNLNELPPPEVPDECQNTQLR